MHNAFKKAVILGKIPKNPCTGVEIKGEKNEKEIQFIESEHISHFLKEAYQYGYIYWIFFRVLIETGIQKGEVAALQWTDIDLKNKPININKSLDFQAAAKDPKEIFIGTKTPSSMRVITISQSLANNLHFHKKYQNQNKLSLKENYHHDLNLVLCRNDGNYMPKTSPFNAFSRIPKSVGFLPLRHTHAVLLLEAGADLKYIQQERLGHGSIQITSDIYSHISKKIEENTINKFEDYMKNVLE
ncbi:site-specific integrase [Peribacillus asahii]|uniref:site-specific integrase n=1 Tax=Peribacillus asahii TaxID=228899 RepID=UPI0020797730|nr:site-specific integrase [Peribacillus asahii]USK68401.1 site-specific integrase [Peribacillus asahii]